jgi:hypothetical protein
MLDANWFRLKPLFVALDLLKASKNAVIPEPYVLFDTWFCSPCSLIDIREPGYDVIAMAKKTFKMHYLYDGKMHLHPLTEIKKTRNAAEGHVICCRSK